VPQYPHTDLREPQGSRKFLPLLSTHATPLDTGSPSGILPKRFLCIAFRRVKNVGDCIYALNDADMASGMCESPVAYVVLCVRFACPPLFTCAAVETACHAPPDAQHSIGMVG